MAITKLTPVYALGAGISGRVTAAKVDEIIDAVNDLTDGVTNITVLEVSSGTAAAPSMSFTIDPDTGIYRIGANNIGISLGGTKYVDLAANLAAFTGAISATTIVTAGTLLRTGDGTVLLPSITFTSDLNTGIYRIGADNIGVSANGSKVLDIATTGLAVTGLVSASTTITAGTLLKSGDGAVGAPSIGFTSDPDSGLYVIGANNIGIAANGAKVLDIATTGLSVVGALSASTSVSAGTIFLSGAGAVGAPAYSFTGQTDMGLYKVSSNQLGVSISGALVGGFNTTGLFTDIIAEQTAASGVTVDGLLIKDGGASATGTSATAGFLYSGTIFATGVGTPIQLDSLVGTVVMSGISDIAADASETVVINNSLVTASSLGMVVLQRTTAAAGSTPRIESVVFGSGTITIILRNSDPATATGSAEYEFSFQLFKL